jgi:hypothetical protein
MLSAVDPDLAFTISTALVASGFQVCRTDRRLHRIRLPFDGGWGDMGHTASEDIARERVQGKDERRGPTEDLRILPYITESFTSCLTSPTFS